MNKILRIGMVLVVLLAVGEIGAQAVGLETMDAVKMFFAGKAIEESDVKITDIVPIGVRELEEVKVKINNTNSDEMQIKVNVFVDNHMGETIWTDERKLTVPSRQGTIPMQIDETINMSDVMRMDVVITDI